jgi:carbonic anhydrase/acetyltransferase-like protein (isoleucine patch superfamily)
VRSPRELKLRDHYTAVPSLLFRSKVGNKVTIGTGAIVVGVTLRDGVQVPNGALITTQEQADALK